MMQENPFPGGVHTFETKIPRWGWYNIMVKVDYSVRKYSDFPGSMHVKIDEIEIWDIEEAEYLPLNRNDPIDYPLWTILAADALKRREDILDEYQDDTNRPRSDP